MWELVFTQTAIKTFEKLQKPSQKRIKQKILRYISQENPLSYAKKLSNPQMGTYRRRIGDYRVIFDIDKEGQLIILLIIGHRRDIYKEI